MIILVVGASGATGRLLVRQLLDRGHRVRAMVRSPEKLPEELMSHGNLAVLHAGVSEIEGAEMVRHVAGCDAIASCLGHNLSFKGLFGHPRMLVADAVRRLCDAVRVNGPERPVRFVLMSSAGVGNRDLPERISLAQRCVIGLVRALLPPHLDNERAADYLRTRIGQEDGAVEWTVVRPDSLTDESKVTDYEVFPSPTRSAIFNAGTTSRVNVGSFLADLITNGDLWGKWKGKMPVIYNIASP